MNFKHSKTLKPRRFKPWIYRWLPESAAEMDEDLVGISLKCFFARHASKQFDRNDRNAINAALKKAKANSVSRAMDEEVTRIVFRLGRTLLPMNTRRPIIYKKPPRDAFEDIASRIAVKQIQTALGISIGIREVDEDGKKSRITQRTRSGFW